MNEALKNKFLCVHGHFYQPPRENPWTGLVDPEESAHPYRDWNERVFAQCYGPNAHGPIPDPAGGIAGMADNYRRISFNFGPTLLAWLEAAHPELHRLLLEADRESLRERGFGNALAQPYYHAILPLQTRSDKARLVRWGLQDFEARFGRKADGMWLPETAVDDETLEVLAAEGLRFTVLSPDQALRVRDLGAGPEGWKEVTAKNLAPTRPYRWSSKSSPGRSLAVFFYHKLLSDGVVSGETLDSPRGMVQKTLARFFPNDSTQLVTIASDGEFYGHHHARGHEALSGALELFEAEGGTLCNFAQFLELFPPPQEVELRERTAWSCAHGLGRWTEDCGCRTKAHPEWRQEWRGPLRAALDGLSAKLSALYEAKAGSYFRDYRSAREGYGRAVGRGPEAARAFLKEHALPALPPEEAHKALELLELERERLAMFTSCGWFFDEVSGLEAALCLTRAARACDLARGFGEDFEPALKAGLAKAPAHLKRYGAGAKAYELLAAPRRATPSRAAARAALLEHLRLPAGLPGDLRVSVLSAQTFKRQGPAGKDRSLTLARLELLDARTLESAEALAAVHQKERLDLSCWVSLGAGEAGLAEDLQALFETRGAEGFERSLSERLGTAAYGLDALYPEERKEALRLLTPFPFKTRERERFFGEWREALAALRRGTEPGEKVWALLESCGDFKLRPDQLPFAAELRAHVRGLLRRLAETAGGPAELSRALRWVEVCETTGLAVDLWELRHLFWLWRARLLKGAAGAEREAAAALGEKLGFSRAALLPLEGTEATTT